MILLFLQQYLFFDLSDKMTQMSEEGRSFGGAVYKIEC
jgi:hypothetical protein